MFYASLLGIQKYLAQIREAGDLPPSTVRADPSLPGTEMAVWERSCSTQQAATLLGKPDIFPQRLLVTLVDNTEVLFSSAV